MQEFEKLAFDIFNYQSRYNILYKDYLERLGIKVEHVKHLDEIPFMPIEFFKSFKVLTGVEDVQLVFQSSGTTGPETSKHFIHDIILYQQSFRKCFELFYGSTESWCILALLPSYIEREDSSLIRMMKHLTSSNNDPRSGFYLHNISDLAINLRQLKKENKKTMLFGVTFALLDFAEVHGFSFPELTLMETGGMKGRKKEMVREEVHTVLCKAFGVDQVHSEYGMTELLSQAYSSGRGIFQTPPWMKVLIRDVGDPFSYTNTGITGGLNIIDLANLDSCSFIATQDLGKKFEDDSFEVLGRFDYSDVRGCNLLV